MDVQKRLEYMVIILLSYSKYNTQHIWGTNMPIEDEHKIKIISITSFKNQE